LCSQSQKYYLTKLISETKDLTLDYNPILEQALRVHLTLQNLQKFMWHLLFVGLIFFTNDGIN
jgi:hypothetical protein